jgi:hypothetical protein
MILQFYSLCQQAAADSWKDLLLLGPEFSGIVLGVVTPVLANYSHPNLCHWPYCRHSSLTPLPDYVRVARDPGPTAEGIEEMTHSRHPASTSF